MCTKENMKRFITVLIFVAILCTSIAFIGCGNDAEKNGGNGTTDTDKDNGNNGTTDTDKDNGNNVTEQKTFCDLVSEVTGIKFDDPKDAPYNFTIGEDDSYCQIDTNPYDLPDYSSTVALGYIKDMNSKLGLPDYLYNDMLHTSYSQGKQEETFRNIKVRYYYHPDKGLNVTYYRI